MEVKPTTVTPRVFPCEALGGAAAAAAFQFGASLERSGKSEVSGKWVEHSPCWCVGVVFRLVCRGVDPGKLK